MPMYEIFFEKIVHNELSIEKKKIEQEMVDFIPNNNFPSPLIQSLGVP